MNDWVKLLRFSHGVRQQFDIDAIYNWIPGCESVYKSSTSLDRIGVDYVATLRGGTRILIDAKTRTPDSSRWWKQATMPELALEIYSVKPNGLQPGKVGWTLNESSAVHLILYTFDPSDTEAAYLLPFQHLRIAFRQNFHSWSKIYRRKDQVSRRGAMTWRSECMFVPAHIVLMAIDAVSRGITMRDFVSQIERDQRREAA